MLPFEPACKKFSSAAAALILLRSLWSVHTIKYVSQNNLSPHLLQPGVLLIGGILTLLLSSGSNRGHNERRHLLWGPPEVGVLRFWKEVVLKEETNRVNDLLGHSPLVIKEGWIGKRC